MRSTITMVCLLLCSASFAQPLVFTHLAGSTGGGGLDDGASQSARFAFPSGVAVDGAGNLYVADTENSTIRKITPGGVVTTLAGTAGFEGGGDGIGSVAAFKLPRGVAVDGAGNVYVADTWNSTIRKITPTGVVTTVAGKAGDDDDDDGTGSGARFNSPEGLAVDSAGNIYVADTGNSMIRKITAAGVVTTIAGKYPFVGDDDGPGADARFDGPIGIAIDNAGNLYVADTENYTIRKITPAGIVSTLAGLADRFGTVDGTGSAARFDTPSGITVDGAGNVYVADTFNETIRKITPTGVVTTFAGSAGAGGSTDATGTAARFIAPSGLATDSSGNVYVADNINSTIRKITPAAVVTTVAGSAAVSGSADGAAAAARFRFPRYLAVDSQRNVYVSDFANSTIRKITPSGAVSTIAGASGLIGSADGTGSAARFNVPRGIAVDLAGNVYVADTLNSTIRKITPAGVVTTLAGTAGQAGDADGTGAASRFDFPNGIAVDNAGNLYVADTNNAAIRKITPAGVVTTLAPDAFWGRPRGIAVDASGNVYVADEQDHTIVKITPAGDVTVVAGETDDEGSDDGYDAKFWGPEGVAVDNTGNLYVADTDNSTIRKIAPDGLVTTLGGKPEYAGSTDGTARAARFFAPSGVAVDSAGNVYVADTFNHAIRIGTTPIPDVAIIDNATVKVGVARQLGTSTPSATSWLWTVIRRPVGSNALLSSSSIRNPTFIPDVADLYQFRLVATNASGTSITTVSLGNSPVRRRVVRGR